LQVRPLAGLGLCVGLCASAGGCGEWIDDLLVDRHPPGPGGSHFDGGLVNDGGSAEASVDAGDASVDAGNGAVRCRASIDCDDDDKCNDDFCTNGVCTHVERMYFSAHKDADSTIFRFDRADLTFRPVAQLKGLFDGAGMDSGGDVCGFISDNDVNLDEDRLVCLTREGKIRDRGRVDARALAGTLWIGGGTYNTDGRMLVTGTDDYGKGTGVQLHLAGNTAQAGPVFTGETVHATDWAVNPTDGTLWAFDGQWLGTVDLKTGEFKPLKYYWPREPRARLTGEAMFFGQDGTLFMSGFDNTTSGAWLYSVDLSTFAATKLLYAPDIGTIMDGMSCTPYRPQ